MNGEAAFVGALALGYTLGRVRPWHRFCDRAWSRVMFGPLKTKRQRRVAFFTFAAAFPLRALKAWRTRKEPKPRREVTLNPMLMREGGWLMSSERGPKPPKVEQQRRDLILTDRPLYQYIVALESAKVWDAAGDQASGCDDGMALANRFWGRSAKCKDSAKSFAEATDE